MASKKSVLRRLHQAQQDASLVTIHHSPRHADRLRGFVVGIGKKWVLLREIRDGGWFDGWTAVRLRDVTRIRVVDKFEARFARQQEEWPPAPPRELDLDRTRKLLRAAGRGDDLVGIQQEHRMDGLWIGRVACLSRHWVWLDEVSPDATWLRQCGYRLGRITAVEIGSDHLTALARTVDEPATLAPPVSHP